MLLEGLRAGEENNIYEENKPPYISINKLTGKAGMFYEKVRYLVDYKDGHTIRRSAIERILKRRIRLLGGNGKSVAEPLVRELIWARYFPDATIPEGILDSVATSIDLHLDSESTGLPAGKTGSKR